MVEVFAFEVNFSPVTLRKTACQIKRRRAAHVITQKALEFILERRVRHLAQICLSQVLHIGMQHFGDECPAETAVITSLVNFVFFHFRFMFLKLLSVRIKKERAAGVRQPFYMVGLYKNANLHMWPCYATPFRVR